MNGQGETVLLDWQLLGVGPLGTDLAMMNTLNLYRLYVPPDEAERYSEATLGAYLRGQREVGVEADDQAVRDAYRAAVALRGGAIVRVIIHQLVANAEGQTAIPAWGRRWGWNSSEAWRAWGESMRFLTALA